MSVMMAGWVGGGERGAGPRGLGHAASAGRYDEADTAAKESRSHLGPCDMVAGRGVCCHPSEGLRCECRASSTRGIPWVMQV